MATVAKAVAYVSGDSTVKGTVTFKQKEGEPTYVSWNISGQDPSAERGMHIHEFGDNTNGCTSAGRHYDSEETKTHGAPEDPMNAKHAGDLGNILTNAQGVAIKTEEDGKPYTSIQLFGPKSIIGVAFAEIQFVSGLNSRLITGSAQRTVVVHAGKDDLGKGDHPDSKTTGNAGGRPACGVIGIAA
ncbi:Superoxide dismutase [Cu-Zn] [Loxospora ochrophaea]|nr:Superoxide dismutase [Cu-Zn] [Loxospora ochrophaea]